MRALTCASYTYMRTTVAELQRRLDELNATQGQPSVSPAPTEILSQGAEGQTKPVRVNPFNQSSEAVQDVFPITLFERREAQPGRPRTFEEMHFAFGERILGALSATGQMKQLK